MGSPPPKPPTSSPPTNESSNPPPPKARMGPPPPVPKFSTPNPSQRQLNTTTTTTTTTTNEIVVEDEEKQQVPKPPTEPSKPPMRPPPPVPKFSTPTIPQEETKTTITPETEPLLVNAAEEQVPESIPDATPKESVKIAVPYTIPPWSQTPCHPFSLEVLKDGSIIDQFSVSEKGAYMFGRVDLCDFVLDHPTISRFHAVLQFKQSGEAYIYDLGSTHGTSVNKNLVKKRVYTELHVGDVIRFGQSSRLYVFQGPTELMPPEGDLKKIRSAKIREEIRDREASLLRAKQEAALADGISWGMAEDAIEETEEDADEVTWQTYKGQLTERQQKTREKVIKRIEKVANMKKEIDAIRVKDIPQGGLTQGQQTQIARNEQRIVQLLEELESLEETLNESIQESIGARSGKVRGKKKGAAMEEEDDIPSDDDDEFYDRTKKSATQKAGEQQLIETADSLLDKKDVIMEEMETKRALIDEKSRSVSEKVDAAADGDENGDPLDAYMTGLSSQLVLDSTMQLQKDLSSLQSELDRILYLLKIADPSGEAARKRESKLEASKSNEAEISTGITKLNPPERKKRAVSAKSTDSVRQEGTLDGITQSTKVPEVVKAPTDSDETKNPVYTVTKPQWLGAIHDTEVKEKQQEAPSDMHDSDDFVDYKDRKEVLGSAVDAQVESGIEAAAPGLIIRKRKLVEQFKQGDDETSQVSTSSSVEAETTAADAVALLLKHKKGFSVSEEEEGNESLGVEAQIGSDNKQSTKDNKKSRRVLGPEKPAFLSSNPDYEAWVPPKGQSGDGRTSLNDRFGY